MTFNYGGVPNSPIPPMLSMSGAMMAGPQGFMGPMMNGQPGGGADPRHFAAMANVVIPGMNDSPLEFNVNKNKPPMPIENAVGEEEKSTSPNNRKRNENKRERDKEKEKDKESGSDGGLPVANALAPNVWGGVVGMGYPVMGMNMIVDPTAAMMTMNNYSMMMGGAETDDSPPVAVPVPVAVPGTVKEIIHCKSCTLFPPNPNAPLPTTRERPPGCRTVFVGGLPENITEEIITEVFERCGEITTLRLSKKNFCHIRFVYEEYVDAAIFLSGYRIRIGSNTDAASNGRLHVDYAQARDDQYEWECRQRQLQREQRHRERMEEERLRPPSPPPVVHYTEHEASSVAEKIKQDESFSKAVQVVVTWLERGDCNKRNSNTFYSMIQSTNSHVRRLLSEKAQYEEELQKAKEIMKGRMQGILIQFGQIERVFSAACHKKVWDHFTKAQRKNIEMWKKQSTEIKQIQLEDAAAAERADDEMDVSDEEESVSVRKRPRPEIIEHGLKDDNDSLRCQLEAYKNEVEVVRSEMKAELDAREEKIRELRRALVAAPPPATDPNSMERDARIVGIVSVFLHVHPFGAGLDYLWSYLRRLEPDLRPADVEELLARFPNLFRQEVSGVGAGMERRWFFAGFRSPPPPPPPPPEEQPTVTAD